MAARANPKLIDEVKHYGADDVVKCYQCGNCSAACTHSEGEHVFPRKSVHYLQLGLEKPLRASLDPWLCYYCGECSEQCPRGAEPGETMMSLRRWLTAQYDFTGISKMLYRSGASELIAVLVLALITGAGFLAFGFTQGGGNLAVYDGPGAFLPAHDIHIFDWSMGGILGLLLGINALRMWYFTMRGEHAIPVPLSLYIKHIFTLPVHFFTQKSFKECEQKRPWRNHLILMLSYVTMLILIMGFVKQMQAGPQVNWYVHFFGYLSAIGLVTMGIVMVRGRLSEGRWLPQALARVRLDVPDPASVCLDHRNCAALIAPVRHARGGQHHVRAAPDGRGSDAGTGSAIRQVVASGVSAPGDLLLTTAGRSPSGRGSSPWRAGKTAAGGIRTGVNHGRRADWRLRLQLRHQHRKDGRCGRRLLNSH